MLVNTKFSFCKYKGLILKNKNFANNFLFREV